MSPPPPADPGHLRRLPPLTPGQTMRPTALFLLHQVDLETFTSPRDLGSISARVFVGSYRLRARHPARSLPGACCACLWLSRGVCITGGSAEVWWSRCCTMKASPGSPWSAARALPRHAIQACAWASGEGHPLLLLPSTLTSSRP
jgi:hypothetical protein